MLDNALDVWAAHQVDGDAHSRYLSIDPSMTVQVLKGQLGLALAVAATMRHGFVLDVALDVH